MHSRSKPVLAVRSLLFPTKVQLLVFAFRVSFRNVGSNNYSGHIGKYDNYYIIIIMPYLFRVGSETHGHTRGVPCEHTASYTFPLSLIASCPRIAMSSSSLVSSEHSLLADSLVHGKNHHRYTPQRRILLLTQTSS